VHDVFVCICSLSLGTWTNGLWINQCRSKCEPVKMRLQVRLKFNFTLIRWCCWHAMRHNWPYIMLQTWNRSVRYASIIAHASFQPLALEINSTFFLNRNLLMEDSTIFCVPIMSELVTYLCLYVTVVATRWAARLCDNFCNLLEQFRTNLCDIYWWKHRNIWCRQPLTNMSYRFICIPISDSINQVFE
jgi:hypothetical protein